MDFDKLYAQYNEKLFRIIYQYTFNELDTEDILQEVWIKVHNNIDNFRGDSTIYSWLYKIAVNTTINYLLKESRQPEFIPEDSLQDSRDDQIDEDINPHNRLVANEAAKHIYKVLESMPFEFKESFVLFNIRRYSYEQIANIVNIPLGTVKSRVNRAQSLIKNALEIKE